jgi:uncharacterized membrane protein YhaH (DUF805 family)
MKWYLKVLRNYTNFSGRARRQEYWMYTVFNLIFALVAMILDNILGTKITAAGQTLPYGYVYMLYGLFVLIPGLAVLVRRMHDLGKSGWTVLLGIIPLVNIILIVFAATAGTPGENKYGPDPKEEVVE